MRGAPRGGALYISQSRDVVLGGTALFALALGMGAPLLALGASAGALLPKAGPWMESVKRFFGVLLLGVAIYIVSPFLPIAVQMGAWAALLIGAAVFLRAIDPLPPNARGFERFSKGVGIIALVTGIAYAIGALSGGRDLLQPLSDCGRGPGGTCRSNPFPARGEPLRARGADRRGGKTGAARFLCRLLRLLQGNGALHTPSPDERVQQRFASLLLLQADFTSNSAEHAALLKRFACSARPASCSSTATGVRSRACA